MNGNKGAHIFEGVGTDGESTGIYIDFVCVNQGKSFAQVTEKGYIFKIVNGLPTEPDFSDIDIFHYTNECIKPIKRLRPTDCRGFNVRGIASQIN